MGFIIYRGILKNSNQQIKKYHCNKGTVPGPHGTLYENGTERKWTVETKRGGDLGSNEKGHEIPINMYPQKWHCTYFDLLSLPNKQGFMDSLGFLQSIDKGNNSA